MHLSIVFSIDDMIVFQYLITPAMSIRHTPGVNGCHTPGVNGCCLECSNKTIDKIEPLPNLSVIVKSETLLPPLCLNSSKEFEISIHTCQGVLQRNVEKIFPDYNSLRPLLILITIQKTDNDLFESGSTVDAEKDLCLERVCLDILK